MLEWSLAAMAASSVASVIVALPPEIRADTPTGWQLTVDGGGTRAESVARALFHVESDLVVVHDAARPLVTPELIDMVLDRLASTPGLDGVIAAAPVTDTIKRTEGRAIVGTEDRSALWSAQTPQAFRTAALRDAIEAAGEQAATATDEATLIEWAGGVVAVEPAPAANLKVTTPADLRLAELLLGAR
jgi:2-C-methyl-D-erythritol 4-phosphate cytidylyltransferase